jgi:thymidylate synthase (FAD)
MTRRHIVLDSDKVDVLDKGYVRYVDHMGSDLSVVNAARVSFAKESKQFSENDAKLISFLVDHDHTSPFRHAAITFEIYAPLMVARQWWKYVVGSDHTMDGWNEASRRYVTMEPEFYLPKDFREAPEDKKQGSGGAFKREKSEKLRMMLARQIHQDLENYDKALEEGVCVEQARLFLPAYAMYTSWRWTASLQSCLHFLRQRLADDAQKEIQDYAIAIGRLMRPIFPVSTEAFIGE